MLYWVEAKGEMQQIGEMDWEGQGQRTIMSGETQLPQPYAISVYQSALYWTDWTTKYESLQICILQIFALIF